MLEAHISSEVEQKRNAVSTAAAEVSALIPRVRQLTGSSEFGREALRRAEEVLASARAAAQGEDLSALTDWVDQLERTRVLFVGVLERLGGQTAVSARTNQLLEAGLWLKMSGDLDGARRLFEQALKLDPDSIRARELLGDPAAEVEAMPQELRDVPPTRSDLFSVPLPRLFQDEPVAPASVPEEWWNAPPSDLMGNTSRFFVRPAVAAPGEALLSTHTIPWGPSPLPPPPAPPGEDFQGDDLGQSGEDFGIDLSEPVGEQPAHGSAPSRTTGAIPLPPAFALAAPAPGPDAPSRTTGAIPLPSAFDVAAPGPAPSVDEPSRTTGAIPLPPVVAPVRGTPPPAAPPLFGTTPPKKAEPSRTTGPVPLPPAVSPVPTTPAPAPAPAPALSTASASAGAVPLPGSRSMPPEPAPPREPVAWSMPEAVATAPSRGLGAVPLPPRSGPLSTPPRGPPPVRADPPMASFAAVPPPPGRPPSFPSDAWGGEGDGPTLLAAEGPAEALDLLAEPRTVSGFTPLPAPRDPRSEAVRLFERSRELQNLDDHSGARELLLQAQALFPELTGLSDALARSEAKLQTIYESKIGHLNKVPRVRLKEDEVIWLNLDHRAGFMLAQIDGALCFEDLFSVSGMSRLDTAAHPRPAAGPASHRELRAGPASVARRRCPARVAPQAIIGASTRW